MLNFLIKSVFGENVAQKKITIRLSVLPNLVTVILTKKAFVAQPIIICHHNTFNWKGQTGDSSKTQKSRVI
jgi:hypothetical protein